MESLHFATEFHNITYSDIEYFRNCKPAVNNFLNDLFQKTCHTKEDDIYFNDTIENADYIEIDKASFTKMLNYIRRLDKNEIVLTCDDVDYTAGEIQSILTYMRNNSPENTVDIILTWYE